MKLYQLSKTVPTPFFNPITLLLYTHKLFCLQKRCSKLKLTKDEKLRLMISNFQPKSKLRQNLQTRWSIAKLISRERHKSAPYLRLKNGKRTSKCELYSFTVPENPKKN